MFAIMELILLALAIVGAYSMAGWIGVVVVALFIVTLVASMVARLRSPRARMLRDISRAIPNLEDIEGIVVHQPNCKHRAHPMDQAHPMSTDDEG